MLNIKLKQGTGCYILKVFCNDDYFNDCNYAYVELTDETKEAGYRGYEFYRDGQKRFGEYNLGAIKLRYGFNVTWLHNDETSSEDEIKDFDCILPDIEKGVTVWEVERISDDEIDRVNDTMDLRTESDHMGVDEYGVMFDCYVKHCDIKLYTESIDINNFTPTYSGAKKGVVTA